MAVNMDTREVYFVVVERIEFGEELLISYGHEYDTYLPALTRQRAQHPTSAP